MYFFINLVLYLMVNLFKLMECLSFNFHHFILVRKFKINKNILYFQFNLVDIENAN